MIAPANPLPPSRLDQSQYTPMIQLLVPNIPYTVSTSRTVDFNLSGIGSEALGGVFRGDTALEGETASRDVILSQTELLK